MCEKGYSPPPLLPKYFFAHLVYTHFWKMVLGDGTNGTEGGGGVVVF